MNYLKNIFIGYRIIKNTKIGYQATMKFIDRIKHQVQLITTIIVLWALIVLGLLVYIAVKV